MSEFLKGSFFLEIVAQHRSARDFTVRYDAKVIYFESQQKLNIGDLVMVKFAHNGSDLSWYIGKTALFDGDDNDIQRGTGNVTDNRPGNPSFKNPWMNINYIPENQKIGMSIALNDHLKFVNAIDIGTKDRDNIYFCRCCYQPVHWRSLEGRVPHFCHLKYQPFYPECELRSTNEDGWQEDYNGKTRNYDWNKTISNLIKYNGINFLAGKGNKWAIKPINDYILLLKNEKPNGYETLIKLLESILKTIDTGPEREGEFLSGSFLLEIIAQHGSALDFTVRYDAKIISFESEQKLDVGDSVMVKFAHNDGDLSWYIGKTALFDGDDNDIQRGTGKVTENRPGNPSFKNPWGYKSSKREIVIQPGLTVINDSEFRNRTDIQKVVLPDSITEIKQHAFCGCKNLEEINLPNNLRKIGLYAFSECEKIKKIDIPEGISEIDIAVFNRCYSLESIKIPSSVVSIQEWAFANCKCLNNIVIPNGVAWIKYHTFLNCEALVDLNISKSMKEIYRGAFVGSNNINENTRKSIIKKFGQEPFIELEK
jgi:hypothetical protein